MNQGKPKGNSTDNLNESYYVDGMSIAKTAVQTVKTGTPQKIELICTVHINGHSVDLKVDTGA